VLGQVVYTLTPRRDAADSRAGGEGGWHLVYTHGGGFVHPLMRSHWAIIAALIDVTGATVTVPIYPLAPEHQHPEAFRELEQVYRGLLDQVAAERIVLCGDSAGGNLALAQALYYRERGLPLPGHLVLFSPWLDLTMSNPEAREVEPRDLTLRIDRLRKWGGWWAPPAAHRQAPDVGGLVGGVDRSTDADPQPDPRRPARAPTDAALRRDGRRLPPRLPDAARQGGGGRRTHAVRRDAARLPRVRGRDIRAGGEASVPTGRRAPERTWGCPGSAPHCRDLSAPREVPTGSRDPTATRTR
jgi:acetyl esterase/lipase